MLHHRARHWAHFPWLALSLTIPLLVGPVALASPTRYALQQIPGRPDRYGDTSVLLRVYDARNGRTVWTRHCALVYHLAWSADHCALAVVDFFGGDARHRYDRAQGPWRLLLWQAGGPVRILWSLAIPHRYGFLATDLLGFDGPEQVAWSPDKARLLIRATPFQGEAGVDVGWLWCLNVRTLRLRLISDSQVYGDARWVDRRRIRFNAYSHERPLRAVTAAVM